MNRITKFILGFQSLKPFSTETGWLQELAEERGGWKGVLVYSVTASSASCRSDDWALLTRSVREEDRADAMWKREWEDKYKVHMAKTPQAHGILNVMRSNDKGLINKHCATGGRVYVGGVKVTMLRLNTIILLKKLWDVTLYRKFIFIKIFTEWNIHYCMILF